MTSPDDVPRDDPAPGERGGVPGPGLPLDEEAAWREIVANYGERPVLGSGSPLPEVPAEPQAPRPVEPRERVDLGALGDLGDLTDGHHFVPPEPPPLPRATPARRLAWLGLFVPPVLMLVAVVLGWTFPAWVAVGLVMAFVGGFNFLVATMPRDRDDGWDDGAVV
jgi:hypothetical protein